MCACLSDGDHGGAGAHTLVFVLEDSVRWVGSRWVDHWNCGDLGDLHSWGDEKGTVVFDYDADTSSYGKRHGGATACWRKRVGLRDTQSGKRLYTPGTL